MNAGADIILIESRRRTRCRLCRNPAHGPVLGSFDKLIADENGLVDHGPIGSNGLCALCALGEAP